MEQAGSAFLEENKDESGPEMVIFAYGDSRGKISSGFPFRIIINYETYRELILSCREVVLQLFLFCLSTEKKNNAQPRIGELGYFFERMFLGLQAWEIPSQINAEKTVLKRKWGN